MSAIAEGDVTSAWRQLEQRPELVRASLHSGGTRSNPAFLSTIGLSLYAGDTALHVAAAAHRIECVHALLRLGANPRARNRRGCEPLHLAAAGSPESLWWEPERQALVIEALVSAGADPNAPNMDGATPLHRAVRSRCADAVAMLLRLGADPTARNKHGSTPAQIATRSTGRSGAGSPAAKLQQLIILERLARYA